jgi:hypothetical protein
LTFPYAVIPSRSGIVITTLVPARYRAAYLLQEEINFDRAAAQLYIDCNATDLSLQRGYINQLSYRTSPISFQIISTSICNRMF